MKKKKETLKQIFITTFSFVIGGVVMFALLKWTPIVSEVLGTAGSTGKTLVTKNETQVYEKGSLAASVEKIYDATALVRTYEKEQMISTGTAFVYKVNDKYGYLLTNNHVVSGGDEVTLVMSNDEEVEGEVLGGDDYLDLAVIRIDRSKVSLVANIGSSEDMKLGDTVFTVGSPMGYDYRGSVTSGILSGKDRMVSVSLSNSSNNDWVMRVLQLDASINPGNSGGPLLNVNGEVIGVCSLKLVDNEIEGMGFAIPIEYAMSHVSTLESGKTIEWPMLGINMANVTDTALLYQNRIILDSDIKEGVVVISAVDGSGAKDAGLKKGDVITKLGGKKVKDYAYLRYELYQHQAGDTIEITYMRDKKEKTVKVKLGKSTE